jgi:aldose sugar dehydrogenase
LSSFTPDVCIGILILVLAFIAGGDGLFASSFSNSDKIEENGLHEAPTITKDNRLRAELVYKGLQKPTSMAFLAPDDILVLEKDVGTVQRIVNGNKINNTVLDVSVANQYERGMLGIDITKQRDSYYGRPTANTTNVFLFLTESSNKKDGHDICTRPNYCESGDPYGNRLYKFKFEENKLVNPQLLIEVPASPGADHIGGVLEIGPDNHIYLITGDGDSCKSSCNDTRSVEASVIYSQTSNFQTGDLPKGRGGIIRISQDGEIIGNGILGFTHPLDMYFAYGIRNSFGIAFDPLTGNLWDTENGPGFGDEINLVEPGFNSGWARAQGMWEITNYGLLNPTPSDRGYFGERVLLEQSPPDKLVKFGGHDRYSNPELAWNVTMGITAIEFNDSDKLGLEYQNDMFIGEINTGNLYRFDLNEERTELDLNGPLSDKIVNSLDELEENTFAKEFPIIVDIEVSPDGYLHVLGYDGSIYKIVKDF